MLQIKGNPGHFICWYNCCWRVHVVVNGKWKISGVGCYHREGVEPDDDNWESLRGVAAWETSEQYKYEIMVFANDDPDMEPLESYWFPDETSAEGMLLRLIEKYEKAVDRENPAG